jgi:Flp pilus assembly protein TadG
MKHTAYYKGGRLGKYQAGAEIVEFLVTLPVVLIIVGMVFEFGVAFSDMSILTQATRSAAREVIRGASDGEAQQAADLITPSLLSLADTAPLPSISVNRAGTNPGDAVTVTINHTYSFVVLPAFLDGITDINLSATTVMNMMNN